MASLVYKKAGNIELVRYSDNKRFLQTGVVDSITESITQRTATLPDGNSDWDLEFFTGKEGTVTVNLSSFVPQIYATLIGATYTTSGTYAIRHILEKTIPPEGPYEIDVLDEGTPVADPAPVVHNVEDSPFAKVTDSPAQGQFAVSGSVFTFNSADAGTVVTLAFDVETEANKTELPDESNRPVFRMTIAGKAVLEEDEKTAKNDTIIFDRVSPTGEIAKPKRGGDPSGWNFTMKLLKPRPGYKVVDYRVEN